MYGHDWEDEMAQFVVNLGFTPDAYYALTLGQRNAIIRAWNTKNRKSR